MSEAIARLAGLLGGGESSGLGGWRFGSVLRAGRGELLVACGGLELGPEELHVPPGLSYVWEEDTGGDSLLRQGDRLVVLVSADGQDYYIREKAVWP